MPVLFRNKYEEVKYDVVFDDYELYGDKGLTLTQGIRGEEIYNVILSIENLTDYFDAISKATYEESNYDEDYEEYLLSWGELILADYFDLLIENEKLDELEVTLELYI